MSTALHVVRSEAGVAPSDTSRGEVDKILTKVIVSVKGALIVSAVLFVTITWALQAAARFN